ncbi:MAG: beta-lactamase family protein [Bacteroidetes bacterium]|nr:beta-lactamase family protein [Bacteroidota bacterium]
MRSLTLFVAVLVVTTSCSRKESSVNNPRYSAEVEARIARVTGNLQAATTVRNVYRSSSLADRLRYYQTPGLSIAVINEGKIEWARGFGIRNEKGDSIDTETLFEAGSVSKPVFALTVMRLKEQGMVDLDKDVNEYLKSWKIPASGNWQPSITLRMLLSHTAGLSVHGFPGYLKSEPIPTIPQLLSGESPSNTDSVKVNIMPGTAFRYSGGGTTVAQLTIMDLTGKTLPEIARAQLFAPLQLKHSTYNQPLPDSLEAIASTGYPNKALPIKGNYHVYPEMAAAGLWTNPSELATIAVEVQKSLKGETSVFRKETIEEMLTPQKVAEHIGIGFFLEQKGDSARFRHGGWDEGFVTELVAYRHIGKGAVIMVNSNQGVDIMDEILRAIAAEYQWPAYLERGKKMVEITATELKSIPGTYLDDKGMRLVLSDSNGSLTLAYQSQSPLALTKLDDGSFKNPLLNFTIKPDGRDLKFTQMGETRVFKRK